MGDPGTVAMSSHNKAGSHEAALTCQFPPVAIWTVVMLFDAAFCSTEFHCVLTVSQRWGDTENVHVD